MSDVRLIDANALKSLLSEVLERIKESPKMTRDEMHIISGCHMLCEMIDDAPTIDAVPVVHGRWVYDRPNHYKCSECDAMWSGVVQFMKFCPHCGAKMDGGADNV